MLTYNFPQPLEDYEDPRRRIRDMWVRYRCGDKSLRESGTDPLRWLSDAEDDITADDPD